MLRGIVHLKKLDHVEQPFIFRRQPHAKKVAAPLPLLLGQNGMLPSIGQVKGTSRTHDSAANALGAALEKSGQIVEALQGLLTPLRGMARWTQNPRLDTVAMHCNQGVNGIVPVTVHWTKTRTFLRESITILQL